MNILFISSENPYPPDHGHYIRTYNLLKYVAGRHNVHFLGFVKREKDLKNVEPIRKICRTADVWVNPYDVSRGRFLLSLFLNIFSPRPYIAGKYYNKKLSARIDSILTENNIDIVHFDILHVSGYRKNAHGIPSVLVEHNVESQRVWRLMKNSSNAVFKAYMYLQYLKLRRFESKECAAFDICAPVSKDDMETLRKMSPSARFVVVPNGVDTAYFAPGRLRSELRSLIWTGGMDNMYNREAVDFFVEEVFPLIEEKVPGVRFKAVGRSPTKNLLRLAAANRNVEATGYVDDVRDAIAGAAVYIAPIKSGGGTKLKVLNALSMARPVVTTTVGAEGIEVVDNEHLLIADDPRLFAEKTIELLRDPTRAARLGENGRKLMLEKYDWDIIGEKMNGIYETLAKGRPGKDKKMRVNG